MTLTAQLLKGVKQQQKLIQTEISGKIIPQTEMASYNCRNGGF